MTAGPRRARILGLVAFWHRLLPGTSLASTLAWAILAVLPLAAEAVPVAEEEPEAGPFVLVLGTAQDGGIPHLGGTAAPDLAARRDPAHRRLVTSLLVVDPRSGRRWLVDASPDLALQLLSLLDSLGGRHALPSKRSGTSPSACSAARRAASARSHARRASVAA